MLITEKFTLQIINLRVLFLRLCCSFALGILITACSRESKNQPVRATVVSDSTIHYAKRFSIASGRDCKILYLFADKKSLDTTAIFILYPNGTPKPEGFSKRAFYIPTPVKRVACLSSVYVAMMHRLGLESAIVAIDNSDYYNNKYVIEKIEKHEIKELAKGPEMSVEQTIVLKPDLVLTFGMGNPEKDVNPKILAANIPVAISLDHLEETPLARAEWIKFIGAFFNADKKADSLFRITESNYNSLRRMCDTVKRRPTVLTEIKYGDAWYVPGGKSFMSHFIEDAGGDYIWKDEDRSGSIPLSFEAVYAKAKNADYWINFFINVNTKPDLLAYDKRYDMFSAFRENHLYNNNAIVNSKGYSDYWEKGISNPDELLKDLLHIFHPDLLPDHKLKYYKKIE